MPNEVFVVLDSSDEEPFELVIRCVRAFFRDACHNFSEEASSAMIMLSSQGRGGTPRRCGEGVTAPDGAAMKQTDAERLDKLAEAYSTNADYCRHLAEIVRNPSSKGHWVRLAESWTTLAGGGQGKVALDTACLSLTQKRPLVSLFPMARWVAARQKMHQ